MISRDENSTLFLSIFSRGLGVLYGLLSLLNFESTENLNIWILSGYVATIVTLANIIVQPSEKNTFETDKTYLEIFGKLFSRTVTKRVFSAFIFQTFLSIVVLVSTDLEASATYIICIFLFQATQYPSLFRILMRHELNYFNQSRVHLLRASMAGNLISLLSILGFYLLDIRIDATVGTFIGFIALQILSLAVQDIMYTCTSKAVEVSPLNLTKHQKAKRIESHRNYLPGLRTYIYVPCVASFWLFIRNPLDPEITSIFLSLNLLTLLTYLGLPNDKIGYDVESWVELKKSLVRIVKRSLLLYLLVFVFLVLALFGSKKNSFAAQLVNIQNISSMAVLSFIGIFLLPLVLVSNNQRRQNGPRLDPLDFAVLSLITSFVTFMIAAKFSATESIAFAYISSFFVWYTIMFWNIRKKASIESIR